MRKFNICLIITALSIAAASVLYQSYEMLFNDGEPMLQGNDDSMYFFWLRSVTIDHDVDFSNELSMSDTIDKDSRNRILGDQKTPLGKVANKYWIGLPLLNAIPYYPTHLIYSATTQKSPTGFEIPYMLSIWIFQLLLAGISLYLSYKILTRFFPKEIAFMAVLLVWLASPLVYYQTARVSMPHNQLFFLTVSIYHICFRIQDGHRGWRNWSLLGLLSGLLVITRSTSVVYPIFPAFVFISSCRNCDALTIFKRAQASIVPALPPVFLQMFAWKKLYGSYIVFSYSGESFDFAHPKLLEILFSDFHGLFNWHPLLLIGFIAFLVFIWKQGKGLSIAWILSSLFIIYINASWWSYWFGSSFGNRAFEGMIFFCMFGVAALAVLLKSKRQRWVFHGIALLLVAWNLQLLFGFLSHQYPREAPVSYPDRILSLGKE